MIAAIQDAGVVTRQVLVVDDDHAVRFVLRRFLDRRGWQVAESASAENALEQLASGRLHVDVVIADLGLPGISGAALCQRIAHEFPTLADRLIIASGDAPRARAALDAEQLACPVIAKPFELHELDEALAGLLANRA